jgi:hypothetical protein
MGLPEIEQAVRNKLHESDIDLADSHYLELAIYRTLIETRPGDTTDVDVLYARVIQLARELRDDKESIELRRTPTDKIFGDALVRALAPTIANLRKREFGSQEPPFASVKDAAEWIVAQSMADLTTERAQSIQREKAYDEIERLAKEHLIEFDYTSTALPYKVPHDEHTKEASTVPGTYLYQLAKETYLIAKHTGLPQDALVMHVLTGLKPIRSRVRITRRETWYTLPSGKQIGASEAVVTFRARDLTDKELRGIYRVIRGHVGGKGTRGLEDKDEYLWELVQNRGGPPSLHGKKGPFWQGVLEDFNRKYPGEITTQRGIEKRYDRILKRLQPYV